MRDEPWETEAVEVAREIFTPFLGTEMAAEAIFEILSNKKETGGVVFRQHEPLPNQVADILNHIRKALQPGLFANIERSVQPIDGKAYFLSARYGKIPTHPRLDSLQTEPMSCFETLRIMTAGVVSHHRTSPVLQFEDRIVGTIPSNPALTNPARKSVNGSIFRATVTCSRAAIYAFRSPNGTIVHG